MAKERRKRLILEFLNESEAMFTQKQLLDNLQKFRYATFSYSTIIRLLDELVEDGLVEKIDEDSTYYLITDKGRTYLEDD